MKKITLLFFLLLSCFAFSQEDCAGVIDLGALTSPYNGDTTGAANDFGQDCLTNVGAPDQVFSILVPDGQQLVIGQSANSYDSKHRLAYGTCPGETLIVCTDDPDTQTETWDNDTGSDQTVFWTQSAFSTGSGTFTLEWVVQDPPAAPDNVDCANATPIVCDETINTSSVGSTGDQEGSGCTMGTNGIWFTFTGTGGDMTLTSTASFDHEMAITSGACGALANVGCDDGSAGEETFTFTSVLDETYYVYIAHWSGSSSTTGTIDLTLTCAVIPTCTPPTLDSSTVVDSCNPDGTGTFTVDHVFSDAGDAGSVLDDGTNTYPIVAGTVTTGPYNSGDSVTIELTALDTDCSSTVGTFDFTCPQPGPENDDLANAIDITCGNTYAGDTSAATIDEADAPDVATIEPDTGADTDSPNVWYGFVGTGDTVTLSTCANTDFDTELFVFTGSSGNLTCIDDGFDECGGSEVNFTAETTFVSVVGTQYWISVEGWNVGNVGAFELTITCVPPPACTPPVLDSSTVVDSCNPDGTGTFTVDHVFSDAGDAGSVLDDGTNTYPIVAGTVTTGPYNSGDSVTIELTALDAACSSTVGTFDFTCPQPAPENDDCAGAIEIACDGQYTGDTTNANPEDPDPGFCGTSAGSAGAVWYRFTGANSNDGAAANGSQGDDVTLDLSLSTFDTKIRVFEGGCDALVCVGGNDDGGTGTTSLFTFTTTVGTDYYVLVHGFSTNAGAYTLDVSCVPPPACIPASFALSDGGNTCPSEDGFVIDVDITNIGSATSVNILLDGAPVISGVDGTASPYSITGLNAATDYDVTIEDAADDTCAATESFSTDVCPPENDVPAGAVEISVGDTLCESPTLGSNVGATDSGEGDPSCGASGYEGGDVWFKVMVPATGELTIETSSADGSGITDTTMEVYSGTSGNLLSAGCDDDGGTGLFSLVELTGLTPGDILLIRVWEFGDNVKGDFNICAWSPTSLGVEDDTFAGFNYYPNPVKDVLTLDSPKTIDKIEVFNVLGQRIIAIDSQNTIQNIDMSNLQSGAYIVKVSIETQTKAIRVLKE
ncbi:T9SS type A sorting domain-containing protein [uncultured Psychroserpens sp.]|uniref:T9SS type A sorting domain-containing protein n=1 Tax=uncultured Psychroserpens sp. TaxID=255436 RepID=UPI0026392C10|nr:T9SS type A sorting domain-containing protein [uncultured Psychroserpens sp.]